MGLEIYYDAFHDLNTCRQSGFGAGPISWASIRDYAQTFEFDDEQQDDLFYFIRVMDNAYLGHHSPGDAKKGGKISARA